MKLKTVLMTLAFVALGFNSQVALAQSAAPETAPKVVKGFVAKCGLYIFGGNPVIKVNLYDTADAAQKSASSIIRPMTDVVLDAGPGYQVTNLFKNSKVRAICEKIQMAQRNSLSAEITANADNVLLSIKIADEVLTSDAYVLKSKEEQDLITDLVRAYLAKDQEVADLRNPPESKK